jgi:hypothetical protein
MAQRAIRCQGCGNADSTTMIVTKDNRYIVCTVCGVRTALFSEYTIHEHTIDGFADKQTRISSATHLINLEEYDQAAKNFEQLTDDFSDSFDVWFGLACAYSKNFTDTGKNKAALPALDHAMQNTQQNTQDYQMAQGAKQFLQKKQEKEERISSLSGKNNAADRVISAYPAKEQQEKSAHDLQVNHIQNSLTCDKDRLKDQLKDYYKKKSNLLANGLALLFLVCAAVLLANLFFTSIHTIKMSIDHSAGFFSYTLYNEAYNGSVYSHNFVAPWWPFIGFCYPVYYSVITIRKICKKAGEKRWTKKRIHEIKESMYNQKESLRSEKSEFENRLQSMKTELEKARAEKPALEKDLRQEKAEYEAMRQYVPGD